MPFVKIHPFLSKQKFLSVYLSLRLYKKFFFYVKITLNSVYIVIRGKIRSILEREFEQGRKVKHTMVARSSGPMLNKLKAIYSILPELGINLAREEVDDTELSRFS